MPAGSVELYEEGAAIVSEYLVRDGKFDEEGITKWLLDDPAQFPGCSGTRKLPDNINDLKAQGIDAPLYIAIVLHANNSA
jgi:5-oxoprolinase (ATP-hydrolysing)